MKRPIRTDFYQGKNLIHSNHARWANNATPQALKYLQVQHYQATHCEVYDVENGILHAVLRYRIGENKIEVIYKREVKEGM